MPRKIKRYGWIPDLPDHRDFMYASTAGRVAGVAGKEEPYGPVSAGL